MELKIHITSDIITITMPKELQSNKFADEFKKIQNIFEEYSAKTVYVYFRNVFWIDNLPMIYLFLLLFKQKRSGRQIYFRVEITEKSIECYRFYKYMQDYGFIACMKEMDADFVEIEVSNMMDTLNEYMEPGNFKMSECLIPLTIIDNYEMANNFIRETCECFLEKYTNDFFAYELQNFIFRISVFLQETIGNVFEHAFSNGKDAFCGVMIRFLHTDNVMEIEEKERNYFPLNKEKEVSIPFRGSGKFKIKNYNQLAFGNNPYRNKIGMKVLDRYLQIFVVDTGMGLLESMRGKDEEIEPREERRLLNDIFKKGIRSQKKSRNTLVGGLGMLYQLFQKNENYISVKGEYNWLTVACTEKKYSHNTLPYVHKNGISDSDVLKGFAIIGYMDCGYEISPKYFNNSLTQIYEQILSESYTFERFEQFPDIEILDFRKELPNFFDNVDVDKILLCYAGVNVEKGLWTNRVNYLFKENRKKDNILILVDIPDREARKYELIFDGFTGYIGKLILVTCSLKISVFTNSSGSLSYDEEETKSYINQRGGDITLSGRKLLNIIRSWDSQKFWKKVSEIQKEKGQKLFVNKEIDWRMEDGGKLDGYLDFSQLSFDDDLVTLLMYQLNRVPQKSKKENYFISMDRFADDLCEMINGELNVEITGDRDQLIHVGSVYVTGTSSGLSKFSLENSGLWEEYYFFKHVLFNQAESSEKCIKALLLWPSKLLTNELFVEEKSEKFERLAKTPFLAPNGTAYFAEQHYKNIIDSVELKQDQSYKIFQSDSFWTERLIKILHMDMDDGHDLIYLNAVSLFTKHYMESRYNEKFIEENCFDYLLKKMYNALGKTPKRTYTASLEVDINQDYRKVVQGKIKENEISNKKGLFVYLADYATIEIVSRLKNIFSDEMQQRIIPIAPVSKKRTASPLLISPILLESIREKIKPIEADTDKNQGISRVTIFIASVTSTRLQRELKHILYRLGAKDINCVCLIDRQRFPLGSREKDSYHSFSKVDLAVLGSEDRCRLCAGLNILETVKSSLFSNILKSRCDEINYIWGKTKGSDSFYKKGVVAKHYSFSPDLVKVVSNICCNDYNMETPIEINSDVGLVLFALEQTAITVSMEFLMKCLKSKNINDEIKTLLIASHLLIFSEDEIVVTDRRTLSEILYTILQRIEECNGYTALACITLLALPKSEKNYLHRLYCDKWNSEHFNNLDFIITSIGIMVTSDGDQDKLLKYWVKNSKEENLDYLYGIFLLTDGNANTRHGTILSRISDTSWDVSEMDYITADNDAAFLEAAYESMPASYFIDPHQYQKKREVVVEIIRRIRMSLSQAARQENLIERKKLANQISEMFSKTKVFNKEIFMNTDIEILSTLQKKIEEVSRSVERRSGNGKMKCYVEQIVYDPELSKKYFYFIEDLRREIMYLIEDFRHSDKQNPIKGPDGEYYNGIIEVVFRESYMSYMFTNHVKETFSMEELLKKKKLKQNRPTIMSLKALYSYSNNLELFTYQYDGENKLYTVSINVPYLGV